VQNPVDEPVRAPRLTFAPDRIVTITTGAAALTAVAIAIGASDAPGRLMAVVGAVVLLGYVLSDLVFSPRLVADADGLTVRSPAVRAVLAWAAVEDVHADARSRFGVRSVSLEIDAGETLVVLTRRALGARPEDVAALVNALRPR
jgi:Bacterial PH domain